MWLNEDFQVNRIADNIIKSSVQLVESRLQSLNEKLVEFRWILFDIKFLELLRRWRRKGLSYDVIVIVVRGRLVLHLETHVAELFCRELLALFVSDCDSDCCCFLLCLDEFLADFYFNFVSSGHTDIPFRVAESTHHLLVLHQELSTPHLSRQYTDCPCFLFPQLLVVVLQAEVQSTIVVVQFFLLIILRRGRAQEHWKVPWSTQDSNRSNDVAVVVQKQTLWTQSEALLDTNKDLIIQLKSL